MFLCAFELTATAAAAAAAADPTAAEPYSTTSPGI